MDIHYYMKLKQPASDEADVIMDDSQREWDMDPSDGDWDKNMTWEFGMEPAGSEEDFRDFQETYE